MALDKGRNLLYVAGKHGIAVFANAGTADGDVAPVSLITGTATGFSGHADMRLALDTSHDRLFVADWLGKTVSVFDNVSTLGGNVAPSRTISGGNTTFSGIWGIAVDVDRDLLYLSDYDTDRVDVFTSASTTSGDIAPTHVLWGGTTTIMGPGDLIIDPGTDTLYLAGGDGNQVLVWNNASTVDGDVAPDRAVVGASTGFKYPADLVLAP